MDPNNPVFTAHAHCINNRDELARSEWCGCFYCATILRSSEISEWTYEPDGGESACCPRCKTDSVIGSASGYPITPEFLDRMCSHWFGTD